MLILAVAGLLALVGAGSLRAERAAPPAAALPPLAALPVALAAAQTQSALPAPAHPPTDAACRACHDDSRGAVVFAPGPQLAPALVTI